MSNGVNAPAGFLPTGHINGSTFNGQTATFYILNGYANNIFTNAPVQLTRLNAGTPTEGLYVTPHPGNNTPVLGVVSGIYYLTPQGLNSPGQLYWPAGTVIPTGTVAVAQVIVDPTVTYDVQSGNPAPAATPVAQSVNYTSIGQNYGFQFPAAGPNGNLQTGQSNASLNIPGINVGGDASFPFKVIGLSPNAGNKFGVPYNNATVVINSSYFSPGTPSQA